MPTFSTSSLIANMEKGFREVIKEDAAKKDTSKITKISISPNTERAGAFRAHVHYAIGTEFAAVDGFEPTKVNVGVFTELRDCYYVAATGELEYETDRINFYSRGLGEWYAKSITEEGEAVWTLCDIDNDDVRIFYNHEMLFDEDMVEIALENAFKNSAKVIYPLQQAISEKVLAHYQANLTPAENARILAEQQRSANNPVPKTIQLTKSIGNGFAEVLAGFIENDNGYTVVQKNRFESGGDNLIVGCLDCKFTTEFEPVEGFEPTKLDVYCNLSDIKYYLNDDTNEWEWLDGNILIGVVLPSTGVADWYRKDGNEWQSCDANPTYTNTPCSADDIPLGDYDNDVAISGLQLGFTKLQAVKYQLLSSITDKALAEYLESVKSEEV